MAAGRYYLCGTPNHTLYENIISGPTTLSLSRSSAPSEDFSSYRLLSKFGRLKHFGVTTFNERHAESLAEALRTPPLWHRSFIVLNRPRRRTLVSSFIVLRDGCNVLR